MQQEQQPQQPEWDGPQWEYRFVEGNNLPQSALKGLGQHGWELCVTHMVDKEGRQIRQWIFKRPKL